MKRLTFKCKLLSDVIINRKSATVGNNLSLDFIPGNNFYGIVANKIYNDPSISDESRFTLLHSGKVKFGDAHPSVGNERSYRVPAAMFYPKLDGIEHTYINHKVTELLAAKKLKRDDINSFQLKQCRDGFYIFKEGKGVPVEVKKTFSLKSAYDREKRKSKDAQMFGYESIDKGLELIFHIYIDDATIDENLIIGNITGVQHIGRSRTAQYGMVDISCISRSEPSETEIKADEEFYVYADSRLILRDEFGNITSRVADSVDFKGLELLLDKTQIRTFQYSPWNFKRQAFDADRHGIEKGSVIAFKATKDLSIKNFVGLYQTEGFGHVLVNPVFLKADDNGKATYKLQKAEKPKETKKEDPTGLVLLSTDNLSPLAKNLALKANDERCRQFIYNKVDEFASANKYRFSAKDSRFASQWGNIRNIAIVSNSENMLIDKLYADETGYLTHGVAKSKWEEQGRLYALKKFINDILEAIGDGDDKIAYRNRYLPIAVINMASQMAKSSTSKETKEVQL